MLVRKMQPNDVEAVYETGIKAEEFRVSDKSRFWTKEELYRWVDREEDILLVAEDNGEILGYVMAQLNTHTRNALIENIYVDQAYRNREIGTQLIKECLKQLKERGATYACGMVKATDERAKKFLDSVGFDKGYDFTWMEIEL